MMTVLLVDGLNLVRRIYAALPPRPEPAATTSSPSTGTAPASERFVATCSTSLQRALKQHRPTHCIAVFEHSGASWRHQLFPDYKKKRHRMPAALADSMAQIEQAFAAVGVQTLSRSGYEADDVIATLAGKIGAHGGQSLILSTDRNYCQLLGRHTRVFDHFNQHHLDADVIRKRFDVQPWQLPHLRALAGDSHLSIPGIASIGIRTAARLINDYGALNQVLEAAGQIPGKLGSKLCSGRQDAELAFRLFTLKTDIDLGINLNQYRYQPPA